MDLNEDVPMENGEETIDVADVIRIGMRFIDVGLDALEDGRGDVTDQEVDEAISDVESGSESLQDAIKRYRQRRQGE